MPKNTYFHESWLKIPEFQGWLAPCAGDPKSFVCLVCKDDPAKKHALSLHNSGVAAVRKHMKGAAHQRNLQKAVDDPNVQVKMSSFLSKPAEKKQPTSDSSPQTSSASVASEGQVPASVEAPPDARLRKKLRGLDSYVVNEEVQRAEVIWLLKMVGKHQSYNSCDSDVKTFQVMFPDEPIAQKMQLKKSKVAYMVPFGLAPYFRRLSVEKIKQSEYFVACFDESFNKVIKETQMDLVIRYWDKQKEMVETTYLSSQFLGHQTAKDLLVNFEDGIKDLGTEKLIQISMDGPKVNWRFLQLYREKYQSNPDEPKLLETGSCGIHVVHGAYKTGCQAALWDLEKFLRNIYFFFNESPARRQDFEEISGKDLFPLKFCGIRWLENVKVIERAMKLLPSLKEFVKKLKPKPKTNQFKDIETALADSFLGAKLEFAKSVAVLFEPFLAKYQSAKPLAPFLYVDVFGLLAALAKRFIKADAMRECENNAKRLTTIFNSEESLNEKIMNAKDVFIGTGARMSLPRNASDLGQLAFYSSCRDFLKATSLKIMERSPLKFPFVKQISCLVPQRIALTQKLASDRFSRCVSTLAEAKRITTIEADKAIVQFASLQADGLKKSRLENFDRENCRLDEFYAEMIGGSEEFFDLWRIVKILLVLSHGNASVESGFSVNKDILANNMQKASLIGQRIVYDSICRAGGHLKIEITTSLLQSYRQGYNRYTTYLEEQKKADKASKVAEEERKTAKDQLKVEEVKKRQLEEELAAVNMKIQEGRKKIRTTK